MDPKIIIIVCVCLLVSIGVGVGVYFLLKKDPLCKDVEKWTDNDRNGVIVKINKLYPSKTVPYLQSLSNKTLQTTYCEKKNVKDEICDKNPWTDFDRNHAIHTLGLLNAPAPWDLNTFGMSNDELKAKLC